MPRKIPCRRSSVRWLSGDTAQAAKLTAQHDSIFKRTAQILRERRTMVPRPSGSGGTGLNAFTTDLM